MIVVNIGRNLVIKWDCAGRQLTVGKLALEQCLRMVGKGASLQAHIMVVFILRKRNKYEKIPSVF